MKAKIIGLVVGVVGLLVGWWGIWTLLHYRSFTEAAEGVVQRRDGTEVVIRFEQRRSSPTVQFSGYEEHAFPLNERTEGLKAGDRVTVYHPPRRLGEARFDRDFPYAGAGVLMGVGVLLVAAAGVVLSRLSRRSRAPGAA